MNRLRKTIGILCLLISAGMGRGQLVDRIVAVANDKIITLTDLRIAEAFDLGFALSRELPALSRQDLLNRMIDRMLVVQLAPEDMLVEEKDIQNRKREIRNMMGGPQFAEALDLFGMESGDLDRVIREEIVYRRIVSRRFSRDVVISVEEMESYYRNQYLPAQRDAGKEPRPLTEILNEIEDALKQSRIENQLQEWLESLRDKADIRIHEER